MFVLYLCVYTAFIIQNIKTSLITICRNFPSITSELEKILMKITYTIIIGLIYLTDTFAFYGLQHCLTINLSIKSQFNGVNDILVEFM